MNDNKDHLLAEINGKRYKAYLCRKNDMYVKTCKECRLFNDCPIVSYLKKMKDHYRKLFKCEPPKRF